MSCGAPTGWKSVSSPGARDGRRRPPPERGDAPGRRGDRRPSDPPFSIRGETSSTRCIPVPKPGYRGEQSYPPRYPLLPPSLSGGRWNPFLSLVLNGPSKTNFNPSPSFTALTTMSDQRESRFKRCPLRLLEGMGGCIRRQGSPFGLSSSSFSSIPRKRRLTSCSGTSSSSSVVMGPKRMAS